MTSRASHSVHYAVEVDTVGEIAIGLALDPDLERRRCIAGAAPLGGKGSKRAETWLPLCHAPTIGHATEGDRRHQRSAAGDQRYPRDRIRSCPQRLRVNEQGHARVRRSRTARLDACGVPPMTQRARVASVGTADRELSPCLSQHQAHQTRSTIPDLLTAAETSLLMDQYELMMAASYHHRAMNEPAVFELFARHLPPPPRLAAGGGHRPRARHGRGDALRSARA